MTIVAKNHIVKKKSKKKKENKKLNSNNDNLDDIAMGLLMLLAAIENPFFNA